jgi:predicted acyltransferase (DUF342 family)
MDKIGPQTCHVFHLFKKIHAEFVGDFARIKDVLVQIDDLQATQGVSIIGQFDAIGFVGSAPF